MRRLSGDDAQAEDAAQETWLRALRSLPSFRGQAKFSTWLFTIANNLAYGQLRQCSREELLQAFVDFQQGRF